MKKILLILGIVVIGSSIFYCNNNGTNPSNNKSTGYNNEPTDGGELIALVPLKDRAGDYAVAYGIDSAGNSAQMILRIAADGTGSIISTDVDKELIPGTLVDGTFGDVNSTEISFTFKFDGEPAGASIIIFTGDNTVKFIPAGAYFGTAGQEYILTKQANELTISEPYTELSSRAGEYMEIGSSGLFVTVSADGTIKFPGTGGSSKKFPSDSKAIRFNYSSTIYLIFTSDNTLTYYAAGKEFECSK